MKPILVASSTLATVAYDPEREVLQLEFRDRTICQYFQVPVEVHQALLRAPSKERYFNRAIRGRFAYMGSEALVQYKSLPRRVRLTITEKLRVIRLYPEMYRVETTWPSRSLGRFLASGWIVYYVFWHSNTLEPEKKWIDQDHRYSRAPKTFCEALVCII